MDEMKEQVSVVLTQVEEALTAGQEAEAFRLLELLPLPSEENLEGFATRIVRLRAICLQRLCRWSELSALCNHFLIALRRAGLFELLREFHAHIGLASLRLGDYHEAEIHLRAAIH